MSKSALLSFFLLLGLGSAAAGAAENAGVSTSNVSGNTLPATVIPTPLLGLRVSGMKDELSKIEARLERARRFEAPGSRHRISLEKRVAKLQKKVEIAQAFEKRIAGIEAQLDELNTIQ